MDAQQHFAAGLIAGIVVANEGPAANLLARVRPLLQRYAEGESEAAQELVRALQTDPLTARAWRRPVFRDSEPEQRMRPETGDDLLNIWVLFGRRLSDSPEQSGQTGADAR